jgi:hypothetical protein
VIPALYALVKEYEVKRAARREDGDRLVVRPT